MNIDHLTIEELIELRNTVEDKIYGYKDGYTYICKVRSYGRNWMDKGVHNQYVLQELCNKYDGYDGIVDVYSTNPNLTIHNYGETKYIKSVEDYEIWEKIENIKHMIPRIEQELEEWDDRDNVPFNKRPYFQPIYTLEDVRNMKMELEELEKLSYTPPVSYYKEEIEE